MKCITLTLQSQKHDKPLAYKFLDKLDLSSIYKLFDYR